MSNEKSVGKMVLKLNKSKIVIIHSDVNKYNICRSVLFWYVYWQLTTDNKSIKRQHFLINLKSAKFFKSISKFWRKCAKFAIIDNIKL